MIGPDVLVVDDDPVNRELATRQLEMLGYTVGLADDGQAALRSIEDLTPRLVLMDDQMPQLTGREATRELRAGERESGHHLPVVAMTANASQTDREACLEAGMDDHLTKPVRLEDLRAVLERWLQPRSHLPDALWEGLDAEMGAGGGRRLAALYLEKLPERLADLRAAAEQADAGRLRNAAHGLRGTSSIFGAEELVEACRDLEARGRAGVTEGARAAVERIQRLAGDLARALAQPP